MKTEMGFDDATEKIDALIRRLAGLRNYTVKRICKESVEKASNIIYEEEKRNISAESEERMKRELKMLRSYRTFVRERGYIAKNGYDFSGMSEKDIVKVLVFEFGRPGTGKRALAKYGFDKLGRKIGVIKPSACIRRAWFAKSKEVKWFLTEHVYDEIRKAWVRKYEQ